jgi:predicted enzyme related to lactoylglutathione lyase
MSIVKIYRYRIQPDKVPQFLNIQREADKLYREKVEYKLSHYQSESDSWQWTEIHHYPNREMLQIAENLSDEYPPLKLLFKEFLETLDPSDNSIGEEIYVDHSVRGSQDEVPKTARAASICYVEIPGAPNLDSTGSFYSTVFGWNISPSNLSDDLYWAFSSGPNDLSGAFDSRKDATKTGILLYLKVDDIQETLRKVKNYGGHVVQEKSRVGGDFGFFAIIRDPSGNSVGVWSNK